MKKNKSKKINLETAALIGLNAFAVGMFLQKVLICGISWMSTIGYLKQEEKMDEKTKRNELLITLADVNNLIEKIENEQKYNAESAINTRNQLLTAYSIKVQILNNL